MKVALFLLGALVAPALSKNFGSIPVDGVGDVFVVGPDWAGSFVQVGGGRLTLNGGGRVYFAKDPADNFYPDMYWQVQSHFCVPISEVIFRKSICLDSTHGQALQLHHRCQQRRLPLQFGRIFH